MSMKLTAQAMEVRVGNPLRKLVLLKLCDNANDKSICWPSIQYVADQCEITSRSVMTHISSLEEAGFLKVMQRSSNGKKISNVYLITLDEGIRRQVEGVKNLEQVEVVKEQKTDDFFDFSSELNSHLNAFSSESVSSSSESPSHLSSESPSYKPVIQPVIEPDINIFNSISLAALPKEISVAAAREFIDHRARIEKPVTQGAFDREMRLALDAIKFGLAPDAVIRECIDAGWWNIKVDWVHARMARVSSPATLLTNSKNQSLVSQLSDRSWVVNKNNQGGSNCHE